MNCIKILQLDNKMKWIRKWKIMKWIKRITSIYGVQANKMPFFIFLVFNTHSLHNLIRAITTSIYNVGTTRKRLLYNLSF